MTLELVVTATALLAIGSRQPMAQLAAVDLDLTCHVRIHARPERVSRMGSHIVGAALEARICRLESEILSLRARVGDGTADVRAYRRETDAERTKLASRVDQLEARLDAVRVARLDTWLFAICWVVTAALYGALAHGFGWI